MFGIGMSEPPLDALMDVEIKAIPSLGRDAGLKLNHFKKSHGELLRVKYVLGFLRSLDFEALLDVSSGRSAFLWPRMSAFPHMKATGAVLLPRGAGFLETVALGGVTNLQSSPHI